MNEPHVGPPAGAWGASHATTITPRAGHGVIVAVSIMFAAALVVSSPAIGGTGLIALLMLLLSCGALVVPVAVMIMTWAQAGRGVRLLFAVAGLASLVVLTFAVIGIVPIVPALLG
jgi:hypothetical protein